MGFADIYASLTESQVPQNDPHAGISLVGVSSPLPVVDVTVALIHEQNVIHLILNVEGVWGHWFV